MKCNGPRRTAPTGAIRSPIGVKHTLENLDCQYSIELPDVGNVVMIKFIYFELEPKYGNKGCILDSLEIFDGEETNDESSLGKFCGSTLPPKLVSTSNKVTLLFHTDSDGNFDGFHLEWESIHPESKYIIQILCG